MICVDLKNINVQPDFHFGFSGQFASRSTDILRGLYNYSQPVNYDRKINTLLHIENYI